jgi:hypothetical protein
VSASSLPSVAGLRDLVLQALAESAGTATTSDLRLTVERLGHFSPDQLEERHGGTNGSELHYRLRWTLVDLRRHGAVRRVSPRTWSLADRDSGL